MRRVLLFGTLFLVVAFPAFSQVENAKLKIRVVLVDGDLNQKPAPRLTLRVVRVDGGSGGAVTIMTSFEGAAEVQLAPGKYRVSTPEPIEFQGKTYGWNADVTVAAPESFLDLSNDNAMVTTLARETPARMKEDLAEPFKKYQNSVVTVWSEFGHGTGFIVDEAGLILTNQHVVGTSEYLAVQFDDRRKIAAKLVAFDPQKDIAVLWANLAAFPEAIAAPMAKPVHGEATVSEGEWVFTIGSPLNQRKILSTGIVSKVEPRAILSDININHGNSGGPLFTSRGTVVGLTTFRESDGSGGGISGIVRIEEAEQLLERAKTKMRDAAPPEARLLPVEPAGTYPVDALKNSLQAHKFDEGEYIWSQGDYDVAIITPLLQYWLTEDARVRAQKEKEKRTRNARGAIQGGFRPLDDLKEWGEYAGEYKPVILIEANPRLGRMIRPSISWKTLTQERIPERYKFKTDFYRMKLFCGTLEIEPIQPGKVENVLNIHNQSFDIRDATYAGVYSYPYEAISSKCSTVTLQLFSEKEPDHPVSAVLKPQTIARIAADFAPLAKGDGKTEVSLPK